jgi:hypothetical protein
VDDDLVAHEAAVDVGELLVGARARDVGHAGAAGDAHGAQPVVDGHRVGQEILAQHVGHAALQRIVAGLHAPLLDQLAFVPDGEAHAGRASAWRRTASTQCASSVASLFRNLRRAGVLKNSSLTSTVVPRLRAAG